MTSYSLEQQNKNEKINGNYIKIKKISKKYRINNDSSNLSCDSSQSWEFTPFPKLYFPSEKKSVIKEINNLNFPKIKDDYKRELEIININKTLSNRSIRPFNKNNSTANIYKEERGDITKFRAPAFSFGISREECKIPFFDLKEEIRPCPGNYNLRPLYGLGGGSKKFSINKCIFRKYFHSYNTPGPGKYNIDNNETKNNGNIILSNFKNSPICNFGKYRAKRDDNFGEHTDWNIKPGPAAYNLNSSVSMFTGTGKFPLSIFKSNLSKSINRCNSLSRIKFHYPSPGPGSYNHHSTFLGYKFD